MKKNLIKIDIEKYDKLQEEVFNSRQEIKDLEKKQEPAHTIVIDSRRSMFECGEYAAKTNDEGTKKLAEDLKDALSEIKKLEREIAKLPKQTTLDDVKGMSWSEFRKWRRSID